jgi:hypothetical protein
MEELSRLCGFEVHQTRGEQSEMWNDIGLSLAAGTEENPLEFFGDYGYNEIDK